MHYLESRSNLALSRRALVMQAATRGFTLLEVLIALVILSIGLLGIAGLQGVGLRSSHGAYLNSQASLLAYDMADRIRVNPVTVAQYHGFSTESVDCAQPLPSTPDSTLADVDLAEWACSVQNLLPSGQGTIQGAFNAATLITTYTIQISWEDLQSDGTPWTFALTMDL